MRVPLSWLKDYTPLGTDAGDAEAVRALGAELDSLGLVVEGIEFVGSRLEGVVLARVREIHAIQGADRIRQVLVDDGESGGLEIVCGASNFAVGDVVPLATVGATLPDGMVIARRTMRNVVSNGMLCSGRELGLSEDGEGLLIVASTGAAEGPLPEGITLGEPVAGYLGLDVDAVFDVAVEPNRPDCLSMTGIARDLAAHLHLPFAMTTPKVAASGPAADELASVEVLAPEACPHLVACVLTDVTVVASPPEVARRLTLSGMRPINAIVDASNYVMLELGQPTHPYDRDRLAGPGLRVRYARPGETLTTLDGVTRTLGEEVTLSGERRDAADLLICDAEDHPVGLAGIMGGESSEISPATSSVLLEVAAFSSLGIGRTSQRQGLRSEASVRFWRGIDEGGLERAAARFCELVIAALEAAGAPPATVAPGLLEAGAPPGAPRQVHVRPARVNALLGTELAPTQIRALLTPLGFESVEEDDALLVTVPSFRPDVAREEDVVEEVARHFGYERIALRARRSPRVGRLTAYQAHRRRLLRIAQGLGAHEAWTSSIVDPGREEALGASGSPVRILNPIVAEESALRAHLLPGLLEAVRRNESHRNGELRLFEHGRVFTMVDGAERPQEREQLAVLLAGAGDDAVAGAQALTRITEALGIAARDVRLLQDPAALAASPDTVGLHPTRRAVVVVRDPSGEEVTVGATGEVDPGVLSAFGAEARRVGFVVLSLEPLFAAIPATVKARPVSRMPAAEIDLAFVLAETSPARALADTLRAAAGELLESLVLIDVYRGVALPEGTRSLAYRLRLRALDHTLTDGEIAAVREHCIAAAREQLGAQLRA